MDRAMDVGRQKVEAELRAQHPQGYMGTQASESLDTDLLAAIPEATAVHLFWSEPAEAQVVLRPRPRT